MQEGDAMSANLAAAAVETSSGAVGQWGGKVPIVIGAVGHRDIFPADGKLVAAIRSECQKLKKEFGASPFVIQSSLAEGADRMIARVAREELGADLIAVLPMPADDFAKDFLSDDSRAEFFSLLKSALYVKVAPVQEGGAWKTAGPARDEQYARAGAIVADHAQILIAIWDGLPARGTAGTGEVVSWFQRGFSPPRYAPHKSGLSPLTPPEPGLLIHIGKDARLIAAGEAGKPGPHASGIRPILQRIDGYNRDVKAGAEAIALAKPLVPEGAGAPELSITEGVYRAADAISVSYATQMRAAERWIYYLAFGSILSLSVINVWPFVSWLYLGVSAVIAVLAFRVRFLSMSNRYIEYRGLAETMRTLYFWRLGGVEGPAWAYCLPRRPGVVHWIAQATRAAEFCQACAAPEPHQGGIPATRQHWVDDQRKWLSRSENENLDRFKTAGRRVRVSILGSFLAAAAITGLTIATDAHGVRLWDTWVKPEIYGVAWQVLLAIFAVFELSGRDNRIHLELAKQYAVQKDIFETAHRQLDAAAKDPENGWTAEQVLEKLGEETLQAQAEWLWREHTKPL
jgi:hypothetical protein